MQLNYQAKCAKHLSVTEPLLTFSCRTGTDQKCSPSHPKMLFIWWRNENTTALETVFTIFDTLATGNNQMWFSYTSSARTVLPLSVPEEILHWATQVSAMTAVGGTNLQISVHRLHFNKLPLNTCYLSCFIWAIFKEVKPYWHQRGVLNFSLSF